MSGNSTSAPPNVDQDGKMINPHNPEFITKVPWYLGNSGPTLKHHAVQKVDHVLTVSESDELVRHKLQAQRAAIQNASKTVYKKGACKNCGAMTHKEKDCVERPRSLKKSAAHSGLDIAPDEVGLQFENFGKMSYASKRDQWKGYDPRAYDEIVEKHNRMQQERAQQKQKTREMKKALEEERASQAKEEKRRRRAARKTEAKAKAGASLATPTQGDAEGTGADSTTGPSAVEEVSDASGASDSDYDSDSDTDDSVGSRDEDDELRANEGQQKDFPGQFVPQGGVGGAGMRVTVRNLRLREDTPKYLHNLALDSAYYDPKSRSMRLNPLPDQNPEDLAFAGDNFVRHTGDAQKLAENQVLCWEMQARGQDVDILTNPSQAELFQKEFSEKRKSLTSEKQKAIMDKYLDGKPNEKMDPRLQLGQTEAYLQYSEDGRLKRDTNTRVSQTKYEEDVFVNNHTSVWGSYYDRGQDQWGYRCCHSLLRNSYCTGEIGRKANDAKAASAAVDPYVVRRMLAKKAEEEENGEKTSSSSSSVATAGAVKRSHIFGESAPDAALLIDEDKLKVAEQQAEAWMKKDHSTDQDDRKRSYNSMTTVEASVESMEAYRRVKIKADDPMAKLLDSDTLLDM